MSNWGKKIRVGLYVFYSSTLLAACGLPNNIALPLSPIITDSNESDAILAFQAPSDTKIRRYAIWYKIYPFLSGDSNLDTAIQTDFNYFIDNEITAESEIRKRSYYLLYQSTDDNVGYIDDVINSGDLVTLQKETPETSIIAKNIFKLTITGQPSPRDIRRETTTSTSSGTHKQFYKDFNLAADSDIKGRRNTDFRAYPSPISQAFAVAFVVQSALFNTDDFEFIYSEVAPIGYFTSVDGFTVD